MDVSYLGPLRARVDGRELPLGGPKPRLVLAHLLLELGRVVSTEQLITAVWGDDPPRTVRNTLQTYVSHLRQVLGADNLTSHRHGYAVSIPPEAIDGPRFETLVRRGRELRRTDPAAAVITLRQAVELWGGRPFADLDGAPSLQPAVVRLEELRLVAEEDRLAAEVDLGRSAEVIGELKAFTAAHPMRERAWELLLLALHRCDRQADALAAFRRARSVLADQVGIDPSDRLVRLHERILAQDPALHGPADPPERAGWDAGAAPGAGHLGSPALPFPTCLTPGVGSGYVGRDELLARLWSHWRTASEDGRSHAVLLAGEAGIGKTRTATELARRVHADGAVVLAGRCEDGLAVPFQPIVELLDWQVHHAPGLPLGRLPGELVRLVPALSDLVPDLPPPVRSDPRAEEHRLYAAVASWVADASRAGGLLLVLDDLQWATTPTLRLLQHVVRSVAGDTEARVLVLGNHRDTDVGPDHPLVTAIAELRRSSEDVAIIPVTPLTGEAVAALIGEVLDPTVGGVPEELVARLLADSDGNPFFAREVLRHWRESGTVRVEQGRIRVDPQAAAGLPAGVRDVVRRRLQLLSPGAVDVLRVTAVLGQDAEVSVLARLVPGGVEQVLDGFEEALGAGMVEEAEPDRFRLTHALVRQALIAELSGPRRRRLHLRIVAALEALRPSGTVALARHAVAALPAEEAQGAALRYAVMAGEHALAQRAPEDAERWFTQARRVAAAVEDSTGAWGLRAQCGLGEAQRDRGDQAYRATLLAAARAALSADRVQLATRAAIANHRATTVSIIGTVDRERVAVLETIRERLEQLPADGAVAADRARVLALLALELTFDAAQHERRLRLVDEAVALAAGCGDAVLQAWVSTTSRIPLTVPERIPQAAQLLSEAVVQADTAADPVLRCASRVSAHQALLGVGDIAAAARFASEAVALADREGVPFLQILARFNAVQYRAYAGDLEGARAMNQACLEFSQEAGETDTLAWWGAIEASLAVVDGTVAELLPALERFADATPDLPAWRSVQALALAVSSEHEAAADLVERWALRDPTTVRRDWLTTSAWTHLAVVAHELGDAQLGRMLVEQLTPHRQCWAHVNVFCEGPLEVHLGLALAAMGQLDDAIAAVRRGRTLLAEREVRSHGPWVALSLARLLLQRGREADVVEARTIAAAAAGAARSMGMATLAERLDGLPTVGA
jgi:DNA-binding SARP family transcriptional activator/tetratricopeptide (TPR) repeat protein